MADSMQFWGVEVKPNQTVKCEPGEEKLLHLSMAALGESKKAADNVVIYVTFDNQKLVIGTLSSEKCAQISYDLVFEKDFELSHSSKNASVYFTGFKSIVPTDDEVPSDSDFSGSDVLEAKSNDGKVERKSKVNALKANKAEQIPDDDDDSEDEDFEDDDDTHDGSSDDEKASDDEDDEDDDSEEEEETPKKAASKDKKRPAEPTTEAVVSEKKKAKLAATPADGKKGAGDAKKETPAKSEKKQQSPKSGGSVSCKSCSKTFNSEKGLESHTKAKHAAK